MLIPTLPHLVIHSQAGETVETVSIGQNIYVCWRKIQEEYTLQNITISND